MHLKEFSPSYDANHFLPSRIEIKEIMTIYTARMSRNLI